jgi:hypothetical protein
MRLERLLAEICVAILFLCERQFTKLLESATAVHLFEQLLSFSFRCLLAALQCSRRIQVRYKEREIWCAAHLILQFLFFSFRCLLPKLPPALDADPKEIEERIPE